MGLYDRDYVRDEPQGFFLGSDRSMVANLILVNVGFFLAQHLFPGMTSLFALHTHDFNGNVWLAEKPWRVYELLTYGFLHSTTDVWHIVFNMFGLWFFGRDVETVYGKREFLRIYLTTIIFAGLASLVVNVIQDQPTISVGASGGVCGMVMLFALHFPRRIVNIWGVLPVPAWLLCGIYIFMDLSGAIARNSGDNVAHEAHLGGAAFAFLYYKTGWNFGRLLPARWPKLRLPTKRPSLRIHDPDVDEGSLNDRVDAILAKISEHGEASLTREERRILEDASRRYQQKRR